jgi:hypothetical protein
MIGRGLADITNAPCAPPLSAAVSEGSRSSRCARPGLRRLARSSYASLKALPSLIWLFHLTVSLDANAARHGCCPQLVPWRPRRTKPRAAV